MDEYREVYERLMDRDVARRQARALEQIARQGREPLTIRDYVRGFLCALILACLILVALYYQGYIDFDILGLIGL